MDKGYIAYFQRFLDFTLPFIKNKNSVLDFGCGESSVLASMLKKYGFSCDYYDPIYHKDGFSKDKKYDVIVSTEVFEHLYNPDETFLLLVKSLKQNGILAIQTEFHPNSIDEFKKWYYHKDSTHIVFFRLKTFEVLAKKYGCRVIGDNGKNIVILQLI